MVKHKNEKRIQGAGFQMLNKSLKKKVVLSAIDAGKKTVVSILEGKTTWIDFENIIHLVFLNVDDMDRLYYMYDKEDFELILIRITTIFKEIYQSTVLGSPHIKYLHVTNETYQVWAKPELKYRKKEKTPKRGR